MCWRQMRSLPLTAPVSCLKHNPPGAQTQSACRTPAPGLHQARVALRAGPMRGHRRAAKGQGGRASACINHQTGRGCLSAAPQAQPGARSEFPGPTLGRSSAGQRRRQAGPMPQGLARRATRAWCPRQPSKRITLRSPTSPSFAACPHPCPAHRRCDTPATAAVPRARWATRRHSAQACG